MHLNPCPTLRADDFWGGERKIRSYESELRLPYKRVVTPLQEIAALETWLLDEASSLRSVASWSVTDFTWASNPTSCSFGTESFACRVVPDFI